MAGCQSQINDAIAHWTTPRVMTYAMPPYMTLRLQLHINPPPPVARPRLLWDMTTKHSSSKGVGGFVSGSQERLSDTYLKNTLSGRKYKISDVGNKNITYYKPRGRITSNGLSAIMGSNSGATFDITEYMKNPLEGKNPVTLKVGDGYLSCTQSNSGKCVLRVEIYNQDFKESLDSITDNTKRFLFIQHKEGNKTLFESLANKDWYICTNNDRTDASPVSVSTRNQMQIFHFYINDVTSWVSGQSPDQSKFSVSGIIIIGDRIAVNVQKDVLDILIQESISENVTIRSIMLAM